MSDETFAEWLSRTDPTSKIEADIYLTKQEAERRNKDYILWSAANRPDLVTNYMKDLKTNVTPKGVE